MEQHQDFRKFGGSNNIMERIKKVLLCGDSEQGTQFLYITDGKNAYIYKAWNDKNDKVIIPEFIKEKATGKKLKVQAVGWNSVEAKYQIINKFEVEMMENFELT